MEKNGENAILLGHIPVHGCLRAWGGRFQALMERYQHIIRFGLFGHSHAEEFYLMRSVNRGDYSQTKPLFFNSILGPTTTYTGNNPSFALYEIDEETMLVVNVTTYFFNVSKANLGNPQWEVYHNLLEAYEIPDFSPKSLESFAERIRDDEATAIKYNMWNAKSGPDGPMGSCDANCRRNKYCNIVNSYKDDETICNNGQKSPYAQKDRDTVSINPLKGFINFDEGAFYEYMADPWLERIY
jgi:hypothetical protein